MKVLKEIEKSIIDNNLLKAFELIMDNEMEFINNSEYWNLKGVLHLKVENYKTAIVCLEKSLSIVNTNGDAYFNCAYAYEKLGCKNDAAKYYELAYTFTNDAQLREELRRGILINKVKAKTSIIVLMYNHLQTTKKCFQYLKKYTHLNEVEIIAVNNGSSDGTKEWLEEQEYISKIIHLDENIGLTRGYNVGIKAALYDEIFLLANDILLTPNWLENLRTCLYHDENVGVISPIMNVAAYFQSIDVKYNSLEEMEEFALSYNKSNPSRWQYRSMVVTCCAFVKKEVLVKCGYFDEIYPAAGSYCDIDLTLTATELGYKNYVCYDTFVHHYGSQTISEGLGANLKLGKKLFKEKKGYCGEEDSGANPIVLQFNEFIPEKPGSFIEIGTGYGCSSSIVNYLFPELKYSGYEKLKAVTDLAGKFLDVKYIENYKDILSGKKYDFVFLNGILRDKNLDWKELESVLRLTSKGGVAFGYFPNRDFIGNLDSEDGNLFTYHEITTLLNKKGFHSYKISSNEMRMKNPTKEAERYCIKLANEKKISMDVLLSPSFLVFANK